jgi:hypothetical protein
MRLIKLCTVMVGVVGFLGSAVAMADEPVAGAPPAAEPATAPPPANETPVAAASAATAPASKMLLGADGAFVLPLGNFSNLANAGVGALVRFEYNVIPNLNLTGHLGFVYYLTKDQGIGYKFWNIPALVGARYDIAQGFYGAAEAGLFFNHASATLTIPGFGTMSSSNTENDFGAVVAAGYRMGDLDARVGLQWVDLGHASDTMGLTVNVGYSFMKM